MHDGWPASSQAPASYDCTRSSAPPPGIALSTSCPPRLPRTRQEATYNNIPDKEMLAAAMAYR